MSNFFTKRDPAEFIKIGHFYYPKGFYEIHDHHLLTHAVREFLMHRQMKAEYQFLLDVRENRVSQVFRIYQKYVESNFLNLSSKVRKDIMDEMGDPRLKFYGGVRRSEKIRPYTRILPKSVRAKPGRSCNPLFQSAQSEVLGLFDLNFFRGKGSTSFWVSPLFTAMHEYRTQRMYRVWNKTQSIPAEMAKKAAKAKALKPKTNDAPDHKFAQTAAALGITVEELKQKMADSFTYD